MEKLLKACQGKTNSNGGLNLGPLRNILEEKYPSYRAKIRSGSRLDVETLCKQLLKGPQEARQVPAQPAAAKLPSTERGLVALPRQPVPMPEPSTSFTEEETSGPSKDTIKAIEKITGLSSDEIQQTWMTFHQFYLTPCCTKEQWRQFLAILTRAKATEAYRNFGIDPPIVIPFKKQAFLWAMFYLFYTIFIGEYEYPIKRALTTSRELSSPGEISFLTGVIQADIVNLLIALSEQGLFLI